MLVGKWLVHAFPQVGHSFLGRLVMVPRTGPVTEAVADALQEPGIDSLFPIGASLAPLRSLFTHSPGAGAAVGWNPRCGPEQCPNDVGALVDGLCVPIKNPGGSLWDRDERAIGSFGVVASYYAYWPAGDRP